MTHLPEWKLLIVGDGTQEPPYQWKLFRRADNAQNIDYYSSPTATGQGETRIECYEAAHRKAYDEQVKTEAWKKTEEYKFDIQLPLNVTNAPEEEGLLDLPVIDEPEQQLREDPYYE